MPALWVGTSFVVNAGSYAAAKLRTKVVLATEADGRDQRRRRRRRSRVARVLKDQFTLSSKQPSAKLRLRRETYRFVIISWVTSLGAIGNLILGTLTLSGSNYISTRDAMCCDCSVLPVGDSVLRRAQYGDCQDEGHGGQ
ncbi:hypothetical protein NLU13_8877 [Sarocladium strictum]|uniref:Uncharacterized protein n=1 Tax=Sarocladium strictum TaxID=5046 RepID=A0AA39G9L5_SARSR|nr:hypothetical protein NLU13_8877 [Sarocladium strictum]